MFSLFCKYIIYKYYSLHISIQKKLWNSFIEISEKSTLSIWKIVWHYRNDQVKPTAEGRRLSDTVVSSQEVTALAGFFLEKLKYSIKSKLHVCKSIKKTSFAGRYYRELGNISFFFATSLLCDIGLVHSSFSSFFLLTAARSLWSFILRLRSEFL